MKITSKSIGEQLKDLGIGQLKEDVSKPFDSPLKVYLSTLATQIVSQLKQSLRDAGVDQNSILSQSIAPEIREENNMIVVEISANDYWDFINSGVNGIQVNHAAPYSFRTPYANKKMAESIQGWMSARSIGTSNNYKSISYAIATKLKIKGIEPNHFVDNVLTDEFINEISLSLSEEFGKQIKLTIN